MSYFTPDIKDNPINKINPSLVTEATLSSMIKSQFSWLGTQQFYEIEAGEVKKVLTEEADLPPLPDTGEPDYSYYGAIKARQLTSELDVKEENLPWRFPLNTSTRAMPVKGETVLCVKYLDEPYYVDVVNRLQNPNLNARDSGMSEIRLEEDDQVQLDYYNEVEESLGNPATPPPDSIKKSYDSQNIFAPIQIQNVKLNPGDTLLQGRFGNVIRFSSDQKNHEFSSNVKISTGQLYNETDLTVLQKLEDNPNTIVEQNINSDASSIYLTENETVDLSVNLISKVIPGQILSNRKAFNGAQVIINSDNVTLNARRNDVHLMASQNVNMTARRRINLEAPIINLGDRTASQAIIKGDVFMEVFKILLVSLKTFATRLGDITAPNPNNKIIELELAAESLKTQIDVLVLPFLSDTLSKRNYTS
jgi:hypothetical protein